VSHVASRAVALKHVRKLINDILRSKNWSVEFETEMDVTKHHETSNNYVQGKVTKVTIKRTE
jgi:hypothetical protein